LLQPCRHCSSVYLMCISWCMMFDVVPFKQGDMQVLSTATGGEPQERAVSNCFILLLFINTI
jgi:hypothetical protein